MRFTPFRLCLDFLVAFVMFVPIAVQAEYHREFVILDGQKIRCPVNDDDQPLPVQQQGIWIDIIASEFRAISESQGSLTAIFGFEVKGKLTVRRVLVENVTGAKSIPVGFDDHPKLKRNAWRGEVVTYKFTPTSPKWLYTEGKTWLIYRFTVSTAEKGDIVIYQAGMIDGLMKARATSIFESARRANRMRAIESAGTRLLDGKPMLFVFPIFSKVSPRAVSDLGKALDQAKHEGKGLILGALELDWAKELVAATLSKARSGQYEGVVLAIIVPTPEKADFETMTGASGLLIKTAPYSE